MWDLSRGRLPEIDHDSLIVRGARYHTPAIEKLLVGIPPYSSESRPEERANIPQQNLKGDFRARLMPVVGSFESVASIKDAKDFYNEDPEAFAADRFAVGVCVGYSVSGATEYLKVGHIARTKSKAIRDLINPYCQRGKAIEFDCTIFWNGDPTAEFRFYTVQLFDLVPPENSKNFRASTGRSLK